MKGLLKHDTDATIVDEYGCLSRDTARFYNTISRTILSKMTKTLAGGCQGLLFMKNKKNVLMMRNIRSNPSPSKAMNVKENISSS